MTHLLTATAIGPSLSVFLHLVFEKKLYVFEDWFAQCLLKTNLQANINSK